MEKGTVYVVTGPSGVGKTTIIKKILSRNQNLEFSVSFTTRKIRENEVEGVDYFFIEDDRFKAIIESGDFLEYAKVHGNYYGTSKRYVINRIESGVNMLLDIDVQGALNVKEKIPEAVIIFVSPPSFRDLAQRLTNRGTETKSDISKRLEDARWELSQIERFHYLIVNNDVEESVCQLEAILLSEGLKIERRNDYVNRFKYVDHEEIDKNK